MLPIVWLTLGIVWLALGVVVFVAGLRAATSERARRIGRIAVGILYVGAGAVVNAALLATGQDYADFADGAYVSFVRDTWRSVVVPNQDVFISLLVVFEATVGVLVLSGGRRAQLGLLGAIAFHVALLSFGWGFYVWSIPMIAALVLLLRAERRFHESPSERPARPAETLRRLRTAGFGHG
ncbi:MAG TPA: hypothetical protein VM386_02120 [Acidimicrobiales bacterium]|nr:hypothetical protein [Acidimicrobiales bacterium]